MFLKFCRSGGHTISKRETTEKNTPGNVQQAPRVPLWMIAWRGATLHESAQRGAAQWGVDRTTLHTDTCSPEDDRDREVVCV